MHPVAWLNFVFASDPFLSIFELFKKKMKIIFHLLLFLFCISYPVVVNAVGSGSNSCLKVLSYFQSIRAPVNAKSMTQIDHSLCQRFGDVLRLRGTKRINQGLRAFFEKKEFQQSIANFEPAWLFDKWQHAIKGVWNAIILFNIAIDLSLTAILLFNLYRSFFE